jgi:imidazolonepropionase-like amidohydrolase
MPRSLSAALVLTLGLVALTRASDPPPFAIKDARIVVAPGKVLEHATIVFKAGVVDAVGSDVTPPPDASVEDGRGLTVYPGFIDAGATFPLEPTTPEARKAREGKAPNLQEDPPVETPEARRKGIHPSLELASSALLEGDARLQERRAGFALALAAPPRGYLAGQSALFALGERARRSSVVATPLFLHAAFEGPEGENGTYPSTLMGAHAHIRQVFADAIRQREVESRDARRRDGLRPPFDPDLDALFPVMDRKLRVAWAATSDEDVVRVLKLAKELGLELAITDARHASKSAALLRREHVPVILSLAWAPKPKPATLEPDPSPPDRKGRNGKPLEGPFFVSLDPAPIGPEKKPREKKDEPRIDPTQEPRAVFEERERKRAEEVATLHALFRAGVPVALSSQGLKNPAEVREHLREAIKAGLPEDVAVAALTRDAALVLGLQGRLGTLERGKLAFATVLTGPLSDEKTKVRFTVVDGERLEAEKLEDDAKLARVAGRYRFATGTLGGELVLSVFAGKLSARIFLEGGKEVAVSGIIFENDHVKLKLPKEATGKAEVPVDARWIAPDALEGTATFPEGPSAFRADREHEPREDDR